MIFKKIIYKIRGLLKVCIDSPQYKDFNDWQSVCSVLGESSFWKNKNTKALDLGCGDRIQNPFKAEKAYGVDLRNDLSNSMIKVANLSTQPIPFANEQFAFISAFDFIEHVPRILTGSSGSSLDTFFPFINLMNEVHRCLQPNGYFLSRTPGYPFSISFTDPTHVNHIDEYTFVNYFSGMLLGKTYGFKGEFEVVRQGWEGRYLITLLKKV